MVTISSYLLAFSLLLNPDTIVVEKKRAVDDSLLSIEQLVPLLRTGNPDEMLMLALPYRTGNGDFVLGPVGPFTEIYDSSGRLKQKISNPQKVRSSFGALRVYVSSYDSLHIIELSPDSSLQHVMNTKGVISRSNTLPFPIQQPVFFSNGDLVVNGVFNSKEGIGHPLHLLTSNGVVKRSFGETLEAFMVAENQKLSRIIGMADSGNIWSSDLRGIYVEHRDTSGILHRVLKRQSAKDAISPFDTANEAIARADTVPLERLTVIRQEGDFLWVVSVVPNKKWVASRSDEEEIKLGLPVTKLKDVILQAPARYNTRIEVIDLKSNMAVIDQALEGLYTILGSWYFARLDPDGANGWKYTMGRFRSLW